MDDSRCVVFLFFASGGFNGVGSGDGDCCDGDIQRGEDIRDGFAAVESFLQESLCRRCWEELILLS